MKLGLLGLWHVHSHGIVRQICSHPDEFELVGCCDADPDLRSRRSAEWRELAPGVTFFESISDFLSLPLDGVVVEGRVSQNVGLARQALESGRPVLLEKPAGVNFADFESLHREAAARGLHVQMTYLFRYMPAVRKLRELVHAGELGEIYEFRGRLPKDRRLYDEYVRDLGMYPGGIFFEMTGHLFDLAIDLLGPPRRVTSFLSHHGEFPGDFVDHGLAVLEFDRARAQIEATALEACPDARRIEVFGSAGAAAIPNLGSGHLKNSDVQPLEVYRTGDAEWRRLELPAEPLQIRDLREFAAVVKGKKRPEFSVEHDLAVQRSLLAGCGIGDVRS